MICRMTLMIHHHDVWRVVAGLLRDGSVQFIPPEEPNGQESETNNWKIQQDHLESLCNQLNKVMESLGIEPPGEATRNLPEKIEHFESFKTELTQVQGEITRLAKQEDELPSQRSRLEAQQETLAVITSREVPLNLWKNAGLTTIVFGWIPVDQASRVALSFQSVPLILIPFQPQGNRLFVAAASLKKHAFILRRFLHSLYFENLEIAPENRASLESSSHELEEKIHQLDQQKAQIQKKRRQLAEKYRDRIQHLFHIFHDNKQIGHVIRQYGLPGEYYHFEIRGAAEQIEQVTAIFSELANHPYNILSVKNEK